MIKMERERERVKIRRDQDPKLEEGGVVAGTVSTVQGRDYSRHTHFRPLYSVFLRAPTGYINQKEEMDTTGTNRGNRYTGRGEWSSEDWKAQKKKIRC